jgi:hypothetical protein
VLLPGQPRQRIKHTLGIPYSELLDYRRDLFAGGRVFAVARQDQLAVNTGSQPVQHVDVIARPLPPLLAGWRLVGIGARLIHDGTRARAVPEAALGLASPGQND